MNVTLPSGCKSVRGGRGGAAHLVAGQSLRHGAQLRRRVLLIRHGHVQVAGVVLLLRWCEGRRRSEGGGTRQGLVTKSWRGTKKESSAIRDRWGRRKGEESQHLQRSFIQKQGKGVV